MDLTKILKDVPQGIELRCPLFKDPVIFHTVNTSALYPISVKTSVGELIFFSKEGYYSTTTAPQNCMLYPPKMESWDNVEYITDGKLVVCERDGKIVQIGRAKGGFAFSLINVYWWYDLKAHELNDDGPFYFDRQVTELEELKVRNLLIEEGYKMVDTELKPISKFKKGDIIVTDTGIIVMFDSLREGTFPDVVVYKAIYYRSGKLKVKTDVGVGYAHNCRLATEEEKNLFFNSLAEAGYFWDGQNITQTFKKGDIVVSAGGCIAIVDHIEKYGSLNDVVYYQCCIGSCNHFTVEIDMGIGCASDCKYASAYDQERILRELKEHGFEIKGNTVVKINKFNFDSLTEFEKVLVRDSCKQCWCGDFFQYMDGSRFVCTSSDWTYCIPYNNDTKHLVGTSLPAPEFYRK